MIEMKIVERPAFRVVGKRTWIGGVDNEQFGRFWRQCGEDGTLRLLGEAGELPGKQTGGLFLGVSLVEKDPSVREFDFLAAAECPGTALPEGCEAYTVPAARWAVFENNGNMPQALVEAEMQAFAVWLPQSGMRHARAPEMEVYPPCDGSGTAVQFWLPVEPGQGGEDQ